MNILFQTATREIARFLNEQLPKLTDNWWHKRVLDRLSFQQQRLTGEKGYSALSQLDFAALLRVLDQNWHDLVDSSKLPRDGRTLVKELQTARNRWAHLSLETILPSEVYRDADTLGRLMTLISASADMLALVENEKASALAAMTKAEIPIGHEKAKAENIENPEPLLKTQLAPKPTLFAVGDLVELRSGPGALIPILEVITGGVECRYKVFRNNQIETFYERQLTKSIAADTQIIASKIDEIHAHLTSQTILSPSTQNLFSLRTGRVNFVPYQYRPVLKMIRADRPRILIADEVGVGKTIEAGLVIKELRARTDITSILVICPKALVAERKWFTELKRFDENFTALDGAALRHCINETHLEGEWPDQYAKSIIPFSLFNEELLLGNEARDRKSRKGLLKLDPPPKFDLVIVDEAHHIRNSDTYLHQGIRYFCDNANAVMLLTATPVQLGSNDLFTLLNVLRPDLIIDHASFDQMAEPNRHINAAVAHCRKAQQGWQSAAIECLNEIAQTEWGGLFICEEPKFQATFDRLQSEDICDNDRVELISSIEGLYTFSPLINRTRRRDIGEFTTRKPETVEIEFTEDQKYLHDNLLNIIARILTHCHGQQNVKFMMTTIRRQASSCLYGLAPLLSNILNGKIDSLELLEASDSDIEIDTGIVAEIKADIEDLLDQARNLTEPDPKIDAFVKLLIAKDKMPNNKALVFSTFRHTLAYLNEHTKRLGLRVGLIHGGISDDERRDLRRRFALPKIDEDAIDILLSSEVGCEGLDFQFCDFMINYDLPWNPMRIEQRIGRIDRYGQKIETITVVNLVTQDTVDADIYNRCLWRIGVFQQSIGGNEEILGEITKELHDIAENFNLSDDERAKRLQQLSDNSIRQVNEERELESNQAELFGLNVMNSKLNKEVEAAESFWLTQDALQNCIEKYIAARAGQQIECVLGEKPLKTLRLNQETRKLMLDDYRKLPKSNDIIARNWEKWLKGAAATLSITFDQETASAHEDATHISIGHPLVKQAAKSLQIGSPKHLSFSAICDDLPQGNHTFALYRWEKHGIRADEELIAVTENLKLELALLKLLQNNSTNSNAQLPSIDECNNLDARHYNKWAEAQANHIAENQQMVDHRIQSLTTSHRARCKAIEDQLRSATNEKIKIMKKSELARANLDFESRLAELEITANSGDIRATPILFGTIEIVRG